MMTDMIRVVQRSCYSWMSSGQAFAVQLIWFLRIVIAMLLGR